MNKSLRAILLVVALLVSMVGAAMPAGAEAKKFDVTLNVVGVNNVISDVILARQDELYEELGIRINFQQFSNEQASNKLAVSFAAGGTDVDAFMFRPLDETLLFVQNGWLEDLQPYIDADPEAADIADYYEASLGVCKDPSTGHIVGFPLMVESAVVFYNKTMFAEKGIETLPIIYSMTQGGPGFATETINILSYRQAFEFMEFGQASATLILFFLIVMAIAALTIKAKSKAEVDF